MKFYVYNWYKFTIVFFVILSFLMGLWGYTVLEPLQIILTYSLMALFVHQFEEYVFPGGGPVVINKGNFGESQDFRTYPGNMLSSMFVNNSAWLVYVVAIIFPQTIWFGLGTMYFNLFQLLGHGLKMNIGMKTWYNPGMASALLLLVPISIYYIYYIASNRLAETTDYVLGIVAFFFMIILTTILPVQLLKNRKSKYAIPEWQVEQMNKVQAFASLKRKKQNISI